jgi:hypothetical protein
VSEAPEVTPTPPNGAPSVVVVTQSKIALLNQAALSILAGIFALGLTIAFLTPLFTTGESILTAGEFIGGIAAAAGVITGSSLATRNTQMRATDTVTAAPPKA